jgi:hypothetical protein
MITFNIRWFAFVGLTCLSPALLAAKGCHCGAGDVPLGKNNGLWPDGGGGDGGSDGSGGSTSGTGPGGSGGNGETGGTGGTGSGGTSSPSDCFSPTQNIDTAYDQGSVGCACEEGALDRCVLASTGGEVALSCSEGRWWAGVDGACQPGFFDYLYCGLPKDPGVCANIGVDRFWFNSATGECESFRFHCTGNRNNFLTKHECERGCRDLARDTICNKPPDIGSCGAPTTAYFYDPHYWRCRPFEWRGCTGSPNVYATEAECLGACVPDAG